MDILDLGITKYKEAQEVQTDLLRRRIEGAVPDTVIFTEHEPVVTLGKLSGEESALEKDYYEKNAIPVVPASRGGKVTCHVPGQLVMYPVIDLKDKKKDVSLYIDVLEKSIEAGLRMMDVQAGRDSKRRGVWAGGRKIAFIGIAVKRWVTYHGAGINLNNDTEPFRHMNPCGEEGTETVSAAELTGREFDMGTSKKIFSQCFMNNLVSEYGVREEALWS